MGGRADGTKIPILSEKTLHMLDYALWMLPFATKSDLIKAAVNAGLSHDALNTFLGILLGEHMRTGAREQLKRLWTAWVKANYAVEERPTGGARGAATTPPLSPPNEEAAAAAEEGDG